MATASARVLSETQPAITSRAIRTAQNGHVLIVTVLRAGDLVRVTRIDPYRSTLEPDDPAQGYQRPPERSRITRIGTYLIRQLGEGLFPTAVVLASRQPVPFADGTIRLSMDQPLQVIDGQHRIAGLRYAIDEKQHHEFADFPVPAVILEVSDRLTEMNQFRIINGTAKSVRTDLVNAILTATVTALGDDAIKDSDRWKVVTTRVVDQLNRDPRSPWFERISMPDETARTAPDSKIVRATSFLTSLKPVYNWLKQLGFFRELSVEAESEKLYEVVVAYWDALKQLVPDAFAEPEQYVVQKTPGLFSLHLLLQEELLPSAYRGRRAWSAETFRQFIEDSPEITDPRFWHVAEGRASAYGSMKGFRELADLLIQSVQPTV